VKPNLVNKVNLHLKFEVHKKERKKKSLILGLENKSSDLSQPSVVERQMPGKKPQSRKRNHVSDFSFVSQHFQEPKLF
jgi:hypothetical protein